MFNSGLQLRPPSVECDSNNSPWLVLLSVAFSNRYMLLALSMRSVPP